MSERPKFTDADRAPQQQWRMSLGMVPAVENTAGTPAPQPAWAEGPSERTIVDNELLAERLDLLHGELQAIEEEIALTVAIARRNGWSWQRVAETLGMKSKQLAMYHYKSSGDRYNEVMREGPDARAFLARMERKLGIRTVRDRYEVRQLVDGVDAILSTHKSLAAARKRAGDNDDLHIVRVDADGVERKVVVS